TVANGAALQDGTAELQGQTGETPAQPVAANDNWLKHLDEIDDQVPTQPAATPQEALDALSSKGSADPTPTKNGENQAELGAPAKVDERGEAEHPPSLQDKAEPAPAQPESAGNGTGNGVG